ncbi:MAG: long-chain fatty acid--CoA ligase [Planctomycetes bacterium]|nr:long-chain fatty acid--CoA ligase [Planctomycetota bacterium]
MSEERRPDGKGHADPWAEELDGAIERYIRGEGGEGCEEAFNALALRLFEYQFERNRIFRQFCRQRGGTPGDVRRWEEIPAAPTEAFKTFDFCCFPPEKTVRTFVSSGTSGASRSRHHLDTLTLYEASLVPNFARHLLPGGERLPLLALTPPAAHHPESSLFHMIETLMRALGAPGSGNFLSPEGRLDSAGLEAALNAHEEAGQPVLLLATAFSLVHFLDACGRRGVRFRLPSGSRLMETGGTKGRSREMPRPALLEQVEACLGVPPSFCVNEYGMTELGVQFYDRTLRDLHEGRPPRSSKSVPHWTRVRILNAESLSPAAPGSPGVIQVCDLTNRGSCLQVLTADIGRWEDGGFQVLGRAAGAEARGCSLTLEEMIRASDGDRNHNP